MSLISTLWCGRPARGGWPVFACLASLFYCSPARGADGRDTRVAPSTGSAVAPNAGVFHDLALSGGAAFACGLTAAGRAYCWGDNRSGQLGIGRAGGYRAAPTQVAVSGSVGSVTIGSDVACALQAGQPLCWGTNEHGELIAGGRVDSRPTPGRVKGSLHFRALSAGDGFVCGITSDDAAACWGSNDDGQLGSGSRSDSVQGQLLVAGGHRFRVVSAGAGSSACGVAQDGIAYCWGDNSTGQLGDGTQTSSPVPVRVAGGLSFVDVSVGNAFACGLTSAGAVYCWGYDGDGGLGDGVAPSRRSVSAPSPVAGGLRFATVSVGFRSACGVDTNKKAYCWGQNEEGQVGDGQTSNRNAPTPVSGGHAFRLVRAGNVSTCGITVDGRTLCWGRGAEGELGNGTKTVRSLRPVLVIGPSG